MVIARSAHDEQGKEMKIVSGWRDYYDFVAHTYGGGDPKVIYNRDYVVPDRVSHGVPHEDEKHVTVDWSPSIPHSIQTISAGIAQVQKHEFGALVVMDRVFILERSGDMEGVGESIVNVRKDWHITSRPILNFQMGNPYAIMKKGEDFAENTPLHQKRRMQELMGDERSYRNYSEQGRKYDGARALCVFAGAPVLVVRGNHRPIIKGRTPKLSSLGLAAYIDPQQLYQELAMFVGNVLKPVEQAPSNMKDIEKVVAHGFDKKASFRHRK